MMIKMNERMIEEASYKENSI